MPDEKTLHHAAPACGMVGKNERMQPDTMIRLIASDIDGTMVPDSSDTIHPGYFDAVRELKKKGITFCACSGRQFHSMQQLLAPVADDIYFITENGTLVRTKDRVLHRWAVDPDQYEALLKDIRAIEGASAVVSFPEVSYVDSGEDSRVFTFLRDSYRYAIENVPDLMALPHDNVLKITIYCENCETACADLVKSHWGRELKMAASGTQWIDICSPDAGKGAALAFLQDYLGCKKEETMYFGDNMNDLPAFAVAGIAATVANARQEVKEKADLIAASYSELGVLKELRRLIYS